MHKQKIKFWSWFGVFAALLVVGVGYVAAQQANRELNITTSPLPINLVAKPGETVSTTLRVKNSGINTETLQVGLLKFGADGENGNPLLQDRGPTDDYFDWVRFSESQFVAEPNVWKEITMSISVPQDAAFGYYYAATFSRAAATEAEPGEAALEGAAATLVLLTVDAPGASRDLDVLSFESTKRVYEFLPAEFTVRLSNTGNVHAKPTGTVFIYKGDQLVDTLPLNEGGGNILPSSKRVFSTTWANGFPVYVASQTPEGVLLDENGNQQKKLSWNFSNATNLRFGKYKASMLISYDDGQKDVPIEASLEFWVVPWRILAGFLVLIVLFGVGLWSMVKRIWSAVPNRVYKR